MLIENLTETQMNELRYTLENALLYFVDIYKLKNNIGKYQLEMFFSIVHEKVFVDVKAVELKKVENFEYED